MEYSLSVVTARTNQPLDLDVVKNHLRVDLTADDDYITGLMAAVREHVEGITNQGLITQTFDMVMDSFPDSSDTPIYLPRYPLSSVTSITYIDANGDSQTWSSDDYIVSTASKPGRITPAYSETYPTTQNRIDAVTIRFVAGHGNDPTDVPDDLKHAMLLLIGHLYEHRSSVELGITASMVPMAFDSLIASHVIRRYDD